MGGWGTDKGLWGREWREVGILRDGGGGSGG